MGQGSFEGILRGVHFDLFHWPLNQGHDLILGSDVDVLGAVNMAIDAMAVSDRVPGQYLVAAFPESFMADLMLETQGATSVSENDPLSAFRWSGTSKEYVESCLRGPLLSWLPRAPGGVELRDDMVTCGPLPRAPGEAAAIVDEVCAAIREHFESWSMPEPDFGDDDD